MNIFYAPNIHQGGGRALVLPLLRYLKDKKDVIYVLDARLKLGADIGLSGKVYRVKPTLYSKLKLELSLLLISKEYNILCFGNLPPLLARFKQVSVFLQNRYLVDMVPLTEFSPASRLRLKIERLWFKWKSDAVHLYIVQTKTMNNKLLEHVGREALILPLFPAFGVIDQQRKPIEKQYDYIYVASDEGHKNHKRLVEAWVLLSTRNIRPSLILTLDSRISNSLVCWVNEKISEFDLRVLITGNVGHQEIENFYMQSRALIYPSLFESFGLPLLEAVSAGLPVLASDLDYVNDVVEPSATFNPFSVESIADAVSIFSFSESRNLTSCLDAKEFMENIPGWNMQ